MPKTVKDLSAAPYNPRTMSPEELVDLGKALRLYGDLSGVVFNKRTGQLVGGHQRASTLEPGWKITAQPAKDKTGTVAAGFIETDFGRMTYREVDWSEDKEMGANLAANRFGGHFNDAAVRKMIERLQTVKYDLTMTGFNAEDLEKLLRPEHHQADEIPEAPKRATSKPGIIYQLGRHRLLCGSATVRGGVSKLFGTEKAAMVFTDPPYGVSYKAQAGGFDVIQNDDLRGDRLMKLLRESLILAGENTTKRAAFYIWHASSTREDFAAALKAAGLQENQYLFWYKSGIVMGRADYQWAHEPCFYASKDGESPEFYGDRTQPTVWAFAAAKAMGMAVVIGQRGIVIQDGEGGRLLISTRIPTSKKFRAIRLEVGKTAYLQPESAQNTVWQVGKETDYVHPTQKPVELAIRAIENSSKPGQIIYDPFAGSGTTLAGAELTGRTAFLVELDPRYCDVIRERYARLTAPKKTA